MIIKTSRISTASGAGKVGGHVFEGPGNESIETVAGCREDLADMAADAAGVGAKYCIRHVVISPAQATTREQAQQVAAMWMEEFGAQGRPHVLVEHSKPRADGTSHDRHWHLMVAEVDPVSGGVLDSHFAFKRNEKVARLAELTLGHELTAGRHNRAVVSALEREGKTDQADALRHLAEGRLPNSAFTSDAHQTAKRQGHSLPQVREIVSHAWARSDDRQSFQAALAEHGLSIQQGRKKFIVVDGDGMEFGSVDRLVKIRAADVDDRMKGDISNDREKAPVESDLGRNPRNKARHGDNNIDALRGGKGGWAESSRTDNQVVGATDRRPTPNLSEAGRHRLGSLRIERQAAPYSSRLQALTLKAGAVAKRGAKRGVPVAGGSAPIRSASGPKGSGAMSTEAVLHRGTGFVAAAEVAHSDGGGGASDGGLDAEELKEATDNLMAALRRLWRRWVGPAAESPPPQSNPTPPPRGGGSGAADASRAVADGDQPPEAKPAEPAASRSMAPRRRRSTPKQADPGRAAVGYAGMPRGTPYPGLSDDIQRRIDALPPHERESLSRTGSHYSGMQALQEIEARAKRAGAYDRVHSVDAGMGGPRYSPPRIGR